MAEGDDVGRLLGGRPDDPVGQRQLFSTLRASLFGRASEPSRAGRYELGDRIGSGSGGVVYRAHDPELDRAVAIKILREDADPDASRHLAGRLRQEARALAALSHPNVLEIYDVGRDDAGRIFVAMALVEGTDLRGWLKRQRTRVEIYRVFAAAGRGLAAAHAAGIVHRDFKPANVLVGDDDRVRVGDFGLARLEEGMRPTGPSGMLTDEGAVLGTPGYMAPEQRAGTEAGPAADQFSFCAALVEALTGARPTATRPELRALDPRLRRVLARGLDLDPDERWPTMDPLVAALEPGRRASRRTYALLAGGTIAVTAGIFQLSRAPSRCDASALSSVWNPARAGSIETAFAATEAPFAADTWLRAEVRLGAYAETWASAHERECRDAKRSRCLDAQLTELDRLLDVFESADAAVAEHAVAAVARLSPPGRCAAAADPETQQRLAQIKALHAAGRYDEAVDLADSAVQEAVARGAGGTEARARYLLGEALTQLGRSEDAIAQLEQAAWLARSLGDSETAAWAMTSLSLVVGVREHRIEEGRWWARHAAAAIQRAGGNPKIEAERLDNLGVLAYDAGEYDDAERYHKAAIGLADPGSPRASTFIMGLGNVMFTTSRLEEAEALYDRCFEIRRDALGPDHPDTTAALSNLANVYYRQERYDESQRTLEIVLAARTRQGGDTGAAVAHATHNLGNVHLGQGEYERARELYSEALAIWERVEGKDGAHLGGTLNNLSAALGRLGRNEEALQALVRSVGLLERKLGADHPDLADPLTNLAGMHARTGNTERARSLLERTLAMRRKAYGDDHPSIATSLQKLGGLDRNAGEYERALARYTEALGIRERTQGRDHGDVAYALYGQGRTLLEQGRPEAAVAPLRRALDLLVTRGAERRRLGEARYALAYALADLGRKPAEVRPIAERALQDFLASGEVKEIEVGETRDLLVRIGNPHPR